MVDRSIPQVGSRVSLQLFAGDLLAHQGQVSVESYPSSGYVSALLSDGAGVKVALTGDRSTVRMVLEAPLAQLDPRGRLTMATFHNLRCALCGQFVAASDREAMLEATRWEWDERLVDEALTDRHFCIDSDPHGARRWNRLTDAGEMVPELRWLLEVALERRQAAGPAGWLVFTAVAASITTVPVAIGTMACCGATSGPLRRPVQARAHGYGPASRVGRSPPSTRVAFHAPSSPLPRRSPCPSPPSRRRLRCAGRWPQPS